MQAKTERFELRLEQTTIDELDAWRARQQDLPSRAEAVRRLLEAALRTAPSSQFSITAGEKLILAMIADIHEHLEVEGDIDPQFVKNAIFGGGAWAVRAKYSGLGTPDEAPEVVEETKDILQMWRIIDASVARLSPQERAQLESEVGPYSMTFEGFDGNHDPHISVMKTMIKDLQWYEEREAGPMNSHSESSLPRYRAMLQRFEAATRDHDYKLTFDKLRAILGPPRKAS